MPVLLSYAGSKKPKTRGKTERKYAFFSSLLVIVDEFIFKGGTLDGSGVLSLGNSTWGDDEDLDGGTMAGTGRTIVSGTMNIVGAAEHFLKDDHEITNNGKVSWPGSGGIWISGKPKIKNNTGSEFVIEANGDFVANGATTPIFENKGIFTKKLGLDESDIPAVMEFKNTGQINIKNGKLAVGNFKFTSGSVTVDSGASAEVDSFTWTTGTFNVSGNVEFSNAYTQVGAASVTHIKGGKLTAPTVTIQAGTLRGWGTIVGDMQNNATVIVDKATLKNVLRTDYFEGGIFVTGNYTNAGSTSLSTRTKLSVSGAYTQTAGSTTLPSSSLLKVTGAYSQTVGTATLTNATIAAASLNMGTTAILSGSGKLIGNVTNDGEIRPGGNASAGTLSITGNYTQTTNGILSMEIGGTSTTAYDRLLISGIASLAGTLNVTLINGFNPAVNDTFLVLTFASLGSETMTENLPSLNAQYNATNLTLTKT